MRSGLSEGSESGAMSDCITLLSSSVSVPLTRGTNIDTATHT